MSAVQAQTKDLLLLYQGVSHFLRSMSRSFVDYPKKIKMVINTFGFLAPAIPFVVVALFVAVPTVP